MPDHLFLKPELRTQPRAALVPLIALVTLICLWCGPAFAQEPTSGKSLKKCFSAKFGFVFFYPTDWKLNPNPLNLFSTVREAQDRNQNRFEMVAQGQPGDKSSKPWSVRIWMMEGLPSSLEADEQKRLVKDGILQFETEEGFFDEPEYGLETWFHRNNHSARFVFAPGHSRRREGIRQIMRSFTFLTPDELAKGETEIPPEPECRRYQQERRQFPDLIGKMDLWDQVALEKACRAIEENPLDFRAFYDMGRIYYRYQHPEIGLARLSIAKKIRPEDFDVNVGLACCERDLKKNTLALEHFLRALDQKEDPDIHRQVGEILFEAKNFKDALRHFQIASTPLQIAECQIELGQKQEALDYYAVLRQRNTYDAIALLEKIENKFGDLIPSEPFFPTPPEVIAREGPKIIRALLARLEKCGPKAKGGGRRQIQISDYLTPPFGYHADDLENRLKREMDPEARLILRTFLAEVMATGSLSLAHFGSAFEETYISHDEVHDIFQSWSGKGWREFYRRFPNSSGHVSFSRMSLNRAGDRCLIYESYMYDGLAGSGVVFYLKKGPDGEWQVADSVGLWIS